MTQEQMGIIESSTSESGGDSDCASESDVEMDDVTAFENKVKTFFNIVKKSSIYNTILMYDPIYLKDLIKIAEQHDIQFKDRHRLSSI